MGVGIPVVAMILLYWIVVVVAFVLRARRSARRHETEFEKFALDSASIPSVLLADDAGGTEAGLSFANPGRLLGIAE